MVGSKMSFILYRLTGGSEGELFFVELDFTASTATGIQILQASLDMQLPTSVFLGTDSYTRSGITVYQSYTAGAAKKF